MSKSPKQSSDLFGETPPEKSEPITIEADPVPVCGQCLNPLTNGICIPCTVVVEKQPELEPEPAAMVSTRVPGSIDDLATMPDNFKENLKARYETVELLRKHSIALSYPSDWLLFCFTDPTTGERRISGYLQGGRGIEKIASLWGLDFINVSNPERVSMDDNQFYYVVRGDAVCRLTRGTLENIEGIAGSEDDFVFEGWIPDPADPSKKIRKRKPPLTVEKELRHAARSRYEGMCARGLTGLKDVAVVSIDSEGKETPLLVQQIWDEQGKGKNWKACPKGKGFGSTGERAADVGDAPKCPKCNGPMKYVASGVSKAGNPYNAFWGCLKGKNNCDGTRKAS